ncbi:MAG: MFS transporter [Proteobacteria bacterium]|nr:MFS transporter [Pseudomonadota bacterium]
MHAYLAWGGVALFFLYQYVLRIAPGLVEPELRSAFFMTANDFSTLGSFFMFIYALVQIPCGVLIDRLGVKRVVLSSILLCLVGNGLLIIGNSLWEAQVSRIFMGLGSACGYIGCMKVAADSFPSSNRGFFMGAALTLGLFGPLLAAKPLVHLIETTSWHYAFTVLSVIGVILWFSLVIVMPKEAINHQATLRWVDIKQSIVLVFKTRPILAYAIMTTCFYSPLAVIADLWGVSFLMNHFHLPRGNAANVTMQIYVGAAVSSLLIPWLCERHKEYNRGIIYSWFGMVICLITLLYSDLSAYALIAILITLGVFSSSEILCFGAASHYTTPETSGTTLGVINTFSVLGSACVMQAVGFLLDFKWKGAMDNEGIRVYSSDEYIFALSSILVFVGVLGLVAFFLYRQGRQLRQSELA